jgi:sugar (pentulose or hexulose) kinase
VFDTVARASARAGHRIDAIQVGAYGPLAIVVDHDVTVERVLGEVDDGRPIVRLVGDVCSATPLPDQVAAALADGRLDGSGRLLELDLAGLVVAGLIGQPVIDEVTAADHAGSPLPTPPPRVALACAGTVTGAASRRTRLPVGTPVGAGTIDSWIDLHTMGVSSPGDAGLLLGSTLVMGVVADTAPSPELRSGPHLGTGRFLGGWTSAAGTAVEWAERVTAADRPDGPGTDVVAGAVGALHPGAGGLLALPHLRGERTPLWDDAARGAVVGLTATTTATELRRAMVDAVALSALDIADRLTALGHPVARWVGSGGGFRHGALGAAVCDALGVAIDVVDLRNARGPAHAAAALAGVDPPPLPCSTLRPDRARHERFVALAGLRAALQTDLRPTAHALAALGALDRNGARG